MFKKDDAVSPVIGVILMVAITVILAAVIAAFVFGMTGNVQTTKSIGIVTQLQGTTGFSVTNHGGADVGKLNGVMKVQNSAGVAIGTPGTLGTGVGSTYRGTLPADRRVIVVGTFTDGSTQILLDKTF